MVYITIRSYVKDCEQLEDFKTNKSRRWVDLLLQHGLLSQNDALSGAYFIQARNSSRSRSTLTEKISVILNKYPAKKRKKLTVYLEQERVFHCVPATATAARPVAVAPSSSSDSSSSWDADEYKRRNAPGYFDPRSSPTYPAGYTDQYYEDDLEQLQKEIMAAEGREVKTAYLAAGEATDDLAFFELAEEFRAMNIAGSTNPSSNILANQSPKLAAFLATIFK